MIRSVLSNHSRRLATSSKQLQQQDLIQQLFVQKVREYASKKKTAGGKMVESSPLLQKQLNDQLGKLAKQFGIPNLEAAQKFPTFKFEDKPADEINVTKVN
ncbi:hypothetical protein SNEBB_001432 [Seison nebaliae]|nr:hypothetical protein SNEBB_001432 [Seison nebaliae]